MSRKNSEAFKTIQVKKDRAQTAQRRGNGATLKILDKHVKNNPLNKSIDMVMNTRNSQYKTMDRPQT